MAWREGRLLSRKDIAARILSEMAESFPNLDYQAKVGARFDDTAAGRWIQWIKQLVPNPFPDEEQGLLIKRTVSNHELGLLALDDAYRWRGYRYGDPVILDDGILDEMACVFFLDPVCCRELIELAARLVKDIKLADTFVGPSVTLTAPYGIERI